MIEVEHDYRQRQVRAPRAPQLGVGHLDAVRAVEAAGQAVAQAVLARVAKELRVFHRHRQQRGRRRQHPAPPLDARTLGESEHADRVAADHHRKHDLFFQLDAVALLPAVALQHDRLLGGQLAAVVDIRHWVTDLWWQQVQPATLGVFRRTNHHPHVGRAGQLRQMLEQHIADRIEIERPRQRLAERNQPFQIVRARLGFLRRSRGGHGLGLDFLPLILLMKKKHHRQNDEAGD